jgi:hypothetical protein
MKNVKLFSLSYDINQFLLLFQKRNKNKNGLSNTPSLAILHGSFVKIFHVNGPKFIYLNKMRAQFRGRRGSAQVGFPPFFLPDLHPAGLKYTTRYPEKVSPIRLGSGFAGQVERFRCSGSGANFFPIFFSFF